MITYKWSIEKVKATGDTNIVTHVYWRCEGEDEDVSAACAGVKSLTLGDTFIAYNQLTEQQVLDWCVDIKSATETHVAELLKHKLAQKESEPALPWTQIPA